MELYVTPIPTGSYLVRFLLPDSVEYDRMIVVTVSGDTLFLQGWIGKPLTHSEWKKAMRQKFPKTKRVQFERWNPVTKSMRLVTLNF